MDVKNPFPLTKSTFKDIQFFGVLNWVTFHSQTEKKCGNYFYTSWWKGESCQDFPNGVQGEEEKSPLPLGGVGWNFSEGKDSFIGVILTIQTFFKAKSNIP